MEAMLEPRRRAGGDGLPHAAPHARYARLAGVADMAASARAKEVPGCARAGNSSGPGRVG